LKEKDLEKLEHYANGIADDSEKAWVESLFIDGEKNNQLKGILEKDWKDFVSDPKLTDAGLGHLLDRVHHRIREMEGTRKKGLLYRFTHTYMRIASVLLIPLLAAGGLTWYLMGGKEDTRTDLPVSTAIYAPKGSRVSFTLPDGSSGMLNSNSTLTYSMPFSENRQLKLEGEAWFDVRKDEEHPFEITAGLSTVRVLGTHLNVMAYPEENCVEVVLQEGKVSFIERAGKPEISMIPSERLISRAGQVSKLIVDPSKFTGWTKGRMIFNNDPMAEVARRIERWYNVEVVLTDRELEKYAFRGTFEDDKLEDVFRLLSMTSPIRYRIEPRTMLPNGTYQKQKVTLSLKKHA
jgi:transmembrane sensor